jgi:hypothetical protein
MTRKFRTIKGRRVPLRGGLSSMSKGERDGTVIHGSIFETKKQGEHPNVYLKDGEWGHLMGDSSIGLTPKGKSLQGEKKRKRNESGFGF